ncbi:MAG: OmpA family protein [Desulfobacterales bacterium]|jgi:OOP family OmpA-OmpF porin
MNDSADQDPGKDRPPDNFFEDEDQLKELRELLLGPFQTQLTQLQKRLDTPDLHASDVSQVLPEAIALRSSHDTKMEVALEPITEKAIRASIKKDRQVLVDALFPVMGPAIRRAIASTIQGMIQSFNQVLEYSLSLKGIKWRLEALRTRKQFAEVVLLHTLIYQVEQVFLIHKGTGLVLQHVVGKSIVTQNPDLVSGMLTAIKDFVQDSFGGEKEEELETLRIGERNIWIEQGDQAFLAAVIRGNPPTGLQRVLNEALEEIHFKKREALVSFDGDAAGFEEVRYILDNCLQAQFKEKKRKRAYLPWFMISILLILIFIWIYQIFYDHRRWSNFIANLRGEPGYVVTSYEKKSGKHYISGLRDPLTKDPLELLQDEGLNPERVFFEWEPYYSDYPDYASKRIRDILKPPDSIRLEFKAGILQAEGSSLHAWLKDTRKLVALMPWVKGFQATAVVDINSKLNPPETVTIGIDGTALTASGSASHQWITAARQLAAALPGITQFTEDHLIDLDLITLKNTREKIERWVVLFKAGLNELLPGQEASIKEVSEEIERLIPLTEIFGIRLHVDIIGHADSSGSEEQNLDLSSSRADAVLSTFVSKGIDADYFTAKGIGSKEPLRNEITEQDRAFNRCVTLKVNLPENLL